MGYTHYWKTKQDANSETFAALADDAAALADAFGRDALSSEDGPEFMSERIWFNGAEPDDYETFVLVPRATHFTFCKTQFKPYDRLVCAVLIAAKHHLGDGIVVSSDGDWDEWAPGRDLYAAVFPGRSVVPILSEGTDD